ncbi:hypothetical protein B0H67DRAFT_494305, partial [Lasiosphaeris hirsuta]
YVRLFDLPGTLSGDILRLERGLPPNIPRHCEMEGDIIRPLNQCPDLPPPVVDDDFEETQDIVAQLHVDPSKHFVKKGKYRSEVETLLACQGGSCSGTMLSSIWFLARPWPILAGCSNLDVYKTWLLYLIDAFVCIHSLGIVHRDLHIDNCLFADEGSGLVVCDLESHWGQRAAPEIAFAGGLDAGWTFHSDIYDIGNCIKGIVYANAPITNQVDWPVPPPRQAIVDACMRRVPNERPTLLELRRMVGDLPVDTNIKL